MREGFGGMRLGTITLKFHFDGNEKLATLRTFVKRFGAKVEVTKRRSGGSGYTEGLVVRPPDRAMSTQKDFDSLKQVKQQLIDAIRQAGATYEDPEGMWTKGGNMANSYKPEGEDMSEQSGRMASIAAAAKKIGAGSKPSAKKSGSFAAYFKTRQDSTFATNALRFATKEEAEAYARNLFMRWLGASEWKVEPDTDPPNYVFANGQATPIKESSEDHDDWLTIKPKFDEMEKFMKTSKSKFDVVRKLKNLASMVATLGGIQDEGGKFAKQIREIADGIDELEEGEFDAGYYRQEFITDLTVIRNRVQRFIQVQRRVEDSYQPSGEQIQEAIKVGDVVTFTDKKSGVLKGMSVDKKGLVTSVSDGFAMVDIGSGKLDQRVAIKDLTVVKGAKTKPTLQDEGYGIQEAEKPVAPNDDELQRLLKAASDILYDGNGGKIGYFDRDREAKKLINKAKKFAEVTRDAGLRGRWIDLNYHLKGVKVRKPKPNLNRSFGGVHDPRSYGRGGVADSYEAEGDDIQEDEWGDTGFQTYKDAHKEVQAGLRADMVNQRNKTLALMVQVIRGEISKQKFKKLTGSNFDDLMKNAKWYINQIKKMPKSKLAPVAPAAPTATESVDMDIQEKVEIDGRTRAYRDTVMRLEQARRIREGRSKAMQENRFGGLYDDGSGKGAMIPAPVDFNFQEAMRIVERYRSLREKKKTLFGAPKDKMEDLDAAVAMKNGKFSMSETEMSPKQKEYRKFFAKALKKFGKDSPADMSDAEKKKFFDWLKDNWKG